MNDLNDLSDINDLERRIMRAEDDADALLWEQACGVVAYRAAGLSQQQIADGWINARTGKPYAQVHVFFTLEVHKHAYEAEPRPRFRDVYNDVSHARPPKAPPDPIPFHWINAANTLHRLCLTFRNTWPVDAQTLLPEILRRLAERFEREGVTDDDEGRAGIPAAVTHQGRDHRRGSAVAP